MKQVEIIDMNSGEIVSCMNMLHALKSIISNRIINGGKWCINSKRPGYIPCIEKHLAFIAPFDYRDYNDIPDIPTTNPDNNLPF